MFFSSYFCNDMTKTQKTDKNYSAVILAAGKSIRMGVPKFALKFNENTSFLEKIVNEYTVFGCTQIVVVLNEEGALFLKQNPVSLSHNTRIVTNHHPEWERFYSIKTGLKRLDKSNLAFIHNVDNPFVIHGVLKSMLDKIEDAAYVVPVFNDRGGHPVLLSEMVIKNIIAEKEHDLNFRDFLKGSIKKTVEVQDGSILVNINTDEEYRSFQNFTK